MKEEDTKTVVNIGWKAVGASLMKNFSAYAAKGYILSEMNDSVFIFRKSEPVEADFMLYEGAADDKDRDFAELSEAGYELICSCGRHHILTIPADKADIAEQLAEKRARKKLAAAMALFAAGLAAVIWFIPSEGIFFGAVRSVFSAVMSCGIVFCVMKLRNGRKNGSAEAREQKKE